MKKLLLRTFITLSGIYITLLTLLYIFQEKLIFLPEKLDKNQVFAFDQEFEEITIKATDGILLHGLLFKADSTMGLIFYLHGNAGSLKGWGKSAKTYTDLNYDVFMPGYRGYGKSEGVIEGQEQLFRDNQTVYNALKKSYSEDKILILGYSIGTGLAAKLASENNPRLLILQAPYYNLHDAAQHTYPFIPIPSFLLKYKFETNEYLKNCKMPIVIFHGNEDEVIYYGSALKLKEQFKPQDTLITLNGQGHNGMTFTDDYKTELNKILSR